ncbi:hypothetical protein Chor_013895 [Crotalus horridus]
MAAFADLNILYLPEKEALQKLVEAAAHREFIDAFYKGEGGWVGYSAVAINYVVNYEEKKKEIVKPITPAELFPSLPLVQVSFLTAFSLQGKSKPIKILSRLTLVVSDPSHCNVLRATSTNIKYYDIFAVFPKNAKLFHVACTTLDVDLVCVDVTEKLPFFIKRPSVNVNIILSSGAEKPIQLRSPYDVANLAGLYGEENHTIAYDTQLSFHLHQNAIWPHNIAMEARKTASGVVYTVKKPQTPEEKDDDDDAPLSKKAKKDL